MEHVWKVTGKKPKELETIELPNVFNSCWEWFLYLNNARHSSGFGVSPILYSEMQAFFQLQEIDPAPWEIDIIKMFDATAMEIFNEQQKKQQEQEMARNKARS